MVADIFSDSLRNFIYNTAETQVSKNLTTVISFIIIISPLIKSRKRKDRMNEKEEIYRTFDDYRSSPLLSTMDQTGIVTESKNE